MRLSLPLLLTLVHLACGARSLRPDETVLHVRALAAVAPGGEAVAIAELEAADGAPPLLRLAVIDGDGRTLDRIAGPEAAETAARVRAGVPLAAALPAAVRDDLADRGLAPPGPPAEGPPWTPPPPLAEHRLLRREVDDPRYGARTVLVLSGPGGHEAEVVALAPGRPAVELRFLAGARAVASVGPADRPGLRIADVAPLDLGPAAARLAVDRASTATGDEALALLERAAALAPGEAEPRYRAAAVHAARGARDAALRELAAAIERDPSVIRMRARRDPAFAALRNDPAFVALVRPRPLD